jgi:hypothetical protein
MINKPQSYQQFSPGTSIRNGIVSIDGVNTPYRNFGGDFYDRNTGLNRFDRARNRFNKTGSTKDLFGSSRTLKEFLENRKKIKTGQIIDDPGLRGDDSGRDDIPAGFGTSAKGNFTNQFEGGDPGQFL